MDGCASGVEAGRSALCGEEAQAVSEQVGHTQAPERLSAEVFPPSTRKGAEPEPPQTNVRSSLKGVFQEEFSTDYLRELVGQIKASTRGVKVDVVCKHCSKRQYVFAQVPDWDKILVRAMDVLEQVEGKPGTLAVEDAGITLVVERSWPAG